MLQSQVSSLIKTSLISYEHAKENAGACAFERQGETCRLERGGGIAVSSVRYRGFPVMAHCAAESVRRKGGMGCQRVCFR